MGDGRVDLPYTRPESTTRKHNLPMNSTTQHSVTFLFSPSGRRFCKSFSDVAQPPQAYDNIRTVSAARWEGEWCELVALLGQVPHNTCLIRGDLTPEAWSDVNAGTHILRRLHAKGDDVATLREEAHAWVVLDFDHTDAPFGADAGAAVRAWHDGLPGELRAARSAFYLSASSHQHATVRGHLLVELDRPIGTEEAKALAKRYGADTSVQSPAQPNYFAHPVFDGCTDPLAGRRGPYVFDGTPLAVDVNTTAPKKTRKNMGTAHVGELPAPEPTDRVIELAALPGLEARWLAGGRVETNAWLALCGWLLACGWSRGELVALLFCLDNGESDEAKKAEHLHILGNARAVEGPGAAREWLGELFGVVDNFLGQPNDPLSRAIAAHCSPASVAVEDDYLPPMFSTSDGTTCYVRIDATRDYAPVSPKVLEGALRQYGHGNLLRSSDGERAIKGSTLIQTHPITKKPTVVDLCVGSSTTWDNVGIGLTIGRKLPEGPAECDLDVIAWLELLAGDKFVPLCEWLASCQQKYIGIPATALLLLGPGGVGKTLLGTALARMWGAVGPTSLKGVVSKFNYGAGEHPIVLDDEAECLGSGKVSSEQFRQLVQDDSMTVEPKGREKITVRGCHRYIITANDASAIRFKGVGAEGVAAIADRFLRLEIPRERRAELVAALKKMGRKFGRIDIDRIVRTLRWIGDNVVLDGDACERFLGSDPDTVGARRAVTAAILEEQPDIVDALRRAIDGETDHADALYLRGDTLWVRPTQLATALGYDDRTIDAPTVRATIKPWRDTSRKQGVVRWGGGAAKAVCAVPLRVCALREALGTLEVDDG